MGNYFLDITVFKMGNYFFDGQYNGRPLFLYNLYTLYSLQSRVGDVFLDLN